jgi:3-phenylpropionate/trans-cinnamate dioxygenase ferredoxin reductase component
MPDYKYLIIGGGMTGASALQGIREADPDGPIGLVSAEPEMPYNRPPLTKGLWKDQSLDSIWRDIKAQEVDLHLGRKIRTLNLRHRQATDDRSQTYTYEKLLLATGGSSRHLPFGDNGNIIYYRTLADYRRLRALTQAGHRFAVIGAGFIGSEIAAALSMIGKEVVMTFPGRAISERMFPRELAQFLNDHYSQKGVELVPGETVSSIQRRSGQLVLTCESRREIVADGVVAGIGIRPNTDLAQQAGLRVEDGIVVDEFLCSSHPEIFAAGDVATFYNPALRRRLRVEHEDNANTMGLWAGRNMAGSPQRYEHLPFFYSDFFEFGYEAVGELDSRLATVADWTQPFREGVVYYHRDGQVRGVLLWNVWGQVDRARELISGHRSFRADELRQDLLKAA